MKSYPKTIKRTFNNNLGRFFAIALIVMLGLAIISGLGALSPITQASVNKNLKDYNSSDLIFKSTSQLGFSNKEIEEIISNNLVKDYQILTSIDVMIENDLTRLIYMDFLENKVNKLELISGSFPKNENEIVVERQTNNMKDFQIGDQLTFMNTDFVIVGIVASPLIYSKDGEQDLVTQQPLDIIFYIDSFYNQFELPYTDIYLTLNDLNKYNVFSKEYENLLNKNVEILKSELSFKSFEILTLNENKSFVITDTYTDKVSKLSLIFPLFFIAVVVLVVLTTMTRLIEEERQIIGCYRTLGYGNFKIMFKYVFFSSISCVIGCIMGMLIGVFAIPELIYPGFGSVIFIPNMVKYYDFLVGIIVSIGMIISVSGITALIVLKVLKEKPANLLRPKSPKPGKKIFFEKIPFLWNRTKFKYKSALRNIFRNKKHFIMTLISVGGSTAIVFAGFSLYDVAQFSEKLGSISEAISQISSVLILFACGLCLLVIYNLTNMNISERTREIATLKVLGYHNLEVYSYIYREIFIMSIIAIAFGIPAGCLLVWFLFEYLNIGIISDVSWWSYLATIIILLVLIVIIDLLLIKKIKKVDMNTSLKMID